MPPSLGPALPQFVQSRNGISTAMFAPAWSPRIPARPQVPKPIHEKGTCPGCQVVYAIGRARWPGGLSLRVGFRQSVKSVLGAIVGGLPGLVCWWGLDYGVAWAIFIGPMGAFIGFALTLPGVSTKRVLGGTAGMIVAHNTIHSWGERVYDVIAGDDEPINKAAAKAPPQ